MTTIRPATPQDAAAIQAIWLPIIRDTTVTFSSLERSVEDIAAFIADRQERGREVFVAEQGGTVAGFATYDQFRGGNGYVHAMEHSIVLGPDARGQGMGRALMQSVCDHAAAAGAHTMMAGISGENPSAMAFHAAIGFTQVGRIPESGRKFGRWIDLVLMQKIL
ncbi:GNAT family N-acetyltransferase [Pseudooceanicola sp. MF1-13]|uniref:GNAT family N-acetyltransferase n=1 Tax=Pseudooceanicola sp. MF1-13 TaxID=3379095 RepID=UPI0038915C48